MQWHGSIRTRLLAIGMAAFASTCWAGQPVNAETGAQPVDSSSALRRDVIRLSPGTRVPFELYRKGKKLTIEVETGTLPQKAPTPVPPPPRRGRRETWRSTPCWPA